MQRKEVGLEPLEWVLCMRDRQQSSKRPKQHCSTNIVIVGLLEVQRAILILLMDTGKSLFIQRYNSCKIDRLEESWLSMTAIYRPICRAHLNN